MELTPMMKQYLEIHKQAPDAILFFRLGDFYEMFFDDAICASRVLSLVLTGRSCGLEDRAPMCGVPYHSAGAYIAKLIKAGHKVAICEQVEDPATAKGIVKREIVKIISPGTVTEEELLNEKENNYLLCLYGNSYSICAAYIDISTAEFKTCVFSGADKYAELANEIEKIAPKEIICDEDFYNLNGEKNIIPANKCLISKLNGEYFHYDNCLKILKNTFDISLLTKSEIFKADSALYIKCAGAVLLYLQNNNRQVLKYLKKIESYSQNDYMTLDASTRKNLELVHNMSSSDKYGSLLWVLDNCKTAMGSRKLKEWIENPLIKRDKILLRQNSVTEIRNNLVLMNDLANNLGKVHDLKRIATRICGDSCTAKDLLMLKSSTDSVKDIKNLIKNSKSEKLANLSDGICELEDLRQLIEDSIDSSDKLKEGSIIKPGYDKQIDALREISQNSKAVLEKMESDEREKTKIKTLKIKYNKVFGYYIDITNSYADMVPDNYVRKQTLANSERYYTQELKELETELLTAQEKLISREKEVFFSIRARVYEQIEKILQTADALAELDVLVSFAYTAYINSYCCPEIITSGEIELTHSRHPVIEQTDKNNEFIPNSCSMNNTTRRMQIITGPNMAGKSTYIRQVALIALMAQTGSYVPAQSARISVADRIFTRIGASDDLLSGRSTFMVEMSEVANILKNATKDSLIILDEVGRGTSTYDGMSIAWAVCEYIADNNLLGAKTLFATHYHELTQLSERDGIINLCIRAAEKENGVVFLRKIEEGAADKSYGIEVARLAGLPQNIINRAAYILDNLEKQDRSEIMQNLAGDNIYCAYTADKPAMEENEAKALEKIRSINIYSITPLDALNLLHEIKNDLGE